MTADGPLLISPEILAHLRIGLLDDLSIAAKNLRALVAGVDTDVTNGAVDVDAKHLDLYELTRMIETSSLLQPLAGWPGTPADELHLENRQHRKLAVDALARHRERLVEQLLSDALPHGDKAPLIAQVQALTAFLRNIGAISQAREEAEQHRPETEQRLSSIHAEITRSEQAPERYYQAFEQGTLPAERCQERTARLDARLEELRTQRPN